LSTEQITEKGKEQTSQAPTESKADNSSAGEQSEGSETKGNRRPRGRKPRSSQNNRRRGGRNDRSDRNSDKSEQEWSLDQFQVEEVEGKARFHDFNLPDVLMRAIADLGFEYATPIQAATIKPALKGSDIIGKAQTGTGKTAAFLIGVITDLLDFKLEDEPELAEPRALIIAPTRELALQIASDAEGLVKYAGLRVVSLVGGMDYDIQRKALAEGPVDILVATPGRLIDFVRNREIDLYNVEVLVLDEADRMLSMGFIPDVRTIIRSTPRKGADRQTLLYSATFTDEIMRLAAQWTRDPVTVEIESENKTTDNVSQKVFLVSSDQKYNLLRNYLSVNGIERAIVFCNRRHQTRDLAARLQKDGVKAEMMSGEIPQNKRLKTLENFRSGKIQVLVATDVAGRGIHIDGVSHVVNYQLPEDSDDYVHRIGRTGRAGATGTSICFACEDDSFLIPDIEAQTGVKLECIHPEAELLADVMPAPAATPDESEHNQAVVAEEGEAEVVAEAAEAVDETVEPDSEESTEAKAEETVAEPEQTEAEMDQPDLEALDVAEPQANDESPVEAEAEAEAEAESEAEAPAETSEKSEQPPKES
jgi:ATP-dependent RNA helicase RhlB